MTKFEEFMRNPLAEVKYLTLLECERSIKRLEAYYQRTKICPECDLTQGEHHNMCIFGELVKIYD